MIRDLIGTLVGACRARTSTKPASSLRSAHSPCGHVPRRSVRTVLTACIFLSGTLGAFAQALPAMNSARANAATLGIISGGADGTYVRIAADLSNVLDGNDLRLLPILGRGSLQNLRDIMFLRGVDIGIVQMDAREHLKNENLYNASVGKLRYITRLYNEEVHILASREIADIRQLDGRKVNIDKVGSGTSLTAQTIFDKLGLKPVFTNFDQGSSYERLRSGEIQAAVYVAGRPVRAIAEFRGEGRFHLLPIPFEGILAETYLPSQFTNAEYPQLVDAAGPVETLAVGSVLAAFNWPKGSDRYRRLEKFVNEFFPRFDEFLQPGRHPKWKEVSLTAETPGWERFGPADEWLKRAGSGGAASDQTQSFNEFMSGRSAPASAEDRELLFREFLAWESKRLKAPDLRKAGR